MIESCIMLTEKVLIHVNTDAKTFLLARKNGEYATAITQLTQQLFYNKGKISSNLQVINDMLLSGELYIVWQGIQYTHIKNDSDETSFLSSGDDITKPSSPEGGYWHNYKIDLFGEYPVSNSDKISKNWSSWENIIRDLRRGRFIDMTISGNGLLKLGLICEQQLSDVYIRCWFDRFKSLVITSECSSRIGQIDSTPPYVTLPLDLFYEWLQENSRRSRKFWDFKKWQSTPKGSKGYHSPPWYFDGIKMGFLQCKPKFNVCTDLTGHNYPCNDLPAKKRKKLKLTVTVVINRLMRTYGIYIPDEIILLILNFLLPDKASPRINFVEQ